MTPAEEYSAYVKGLPADLEPDLVTGDTVSTAFHMARRAGWTVEQLVADADKVIARGYGIGLIVTRLRHLMETEPHKRDEPVRSGPQSRLAHGYCPCGVGPLHQPPAKIPGVWTDERHDLLATIRRGGIDPDSAEQMMRDLIEDQQTR